MVQNGREVYKWAVSVLSREIPLWLDKAGYCLEQIDWFVPHSANLRIVEAVCNRIGYPADKVLFSGEYYGNTSSATIPLAIDMAVQKQMTRSGDILMLYGFGGGLVHAGLLLRWDL
jgi:3-oxoacyl-[acyl-carrier-protein] synthase-3